MIQIPSRAYEEAGFGNAPGKGYLQSCRLLSLLRETPTPVVRVREGTDTPSLDGVKFGMSIFPRINAGGTLAYAASLVGTGVTASNNTSALQDCGAGPELLGAGE
jgi:hypothetical protein